MTSSGFPLVFISIPNISFIGCLVPIFYVNKPVVYFSNIGWYYCNVILPYSLTK